MGGGMRGLPRQSDLIVLNWKWNPLNSTLSIKVDNTSFITDSLYIGSCTAGAWPLIIYECINNDCALILGMSNSSVWISIVFYYLNYQFY